MTEPNPNILFCIGAQKAGTTWLHRYFADHPDIHAPPSKELHFFDFRDTKLAQVAIDAKKRNVREIEDALSGANGKTGLLKQRNIDRAKRLRRQRRELRQQIAMYKPETASYDTYRTVLMQRYAGQKWIVDNTPCYSAMRAETFGEMVEAFPDAKFLFVMRDPIERTVSSLRMQHRNLLAKNPDQSFDALVTDVMAGKAQHIMMRSRYDKTLRRLDQTVPSDRVLCLFYETLFCDESIRKLCDFLNVSFVPGRYDKVVFKGGEPSSRVGKLLGLLGSPIGLGNTDVLASKDGEAVLDPLRGYLCGALAHVYQDVFERFGDRVPLSWNHEPMRLPQGADPFTNARSAAL